MQRFFDGVWNIGEQEMGDTSRKEEKGKREKKKEQDVLIDYTSASGV